MDAWSGLLRNSIWTQKGRPKIYTPPANANPAHTPPDSQPPLKYVVQACDTTINDGIIRHENNRNLDNPGHVWVQSYNGHEVQRISRSNKPAKLVEHKPVFQLESCETLDVEPYRWVEEWNGTDGMEQEITALDKLQQLQETHPNYLVQIVVPRAAVSRYIETA